MTALPVERPYVTSFSAYEDLSKCGHLYELKRVRRMPERPGVAMVAGNAFHAATECTDNGEPELDWPSYFTSFIEEKEEKSGILRDQWTVSGRKSKEKPDGETIDVWMGMGQAMLADYRTWRLTTGWRIATGLPGGEVGIEYELSPNIGGHNRRAFVDRIMFDDGGNLGVVDIKTGARKPHTLQLPAYAAKLNAIGVPVRWGAYYMARKGTHTAQRILNFTPEDLAEVYARGDEIIERGLFIPRVSSDCDYCWMREHCKFA